MSTNDNTTPTRFCKICEQTYKLSPENFYRDKKAKYGFAYICKWCSRKKLDKWTEENPERNKQAHAEYYQSNKERIDVLNDIWNAAHADEMKAYFAQYYQDNKESRDAQSKAWKLAHPERVKEIHDACIARNPERRRQSANEWVKSEKGRLARLRRRARVQALPDTLTPEQWAECLDYWNYSCAVCGKADKIHADHYIPLADPKCPGTVANNIIPLCKSCNSSKCDRLPDEWILRKVGIQGQILLERIEEYFEHIAIVFS
jgi:5-methylcytosine-specific restriction endonuclease McrA